MSMVGLPTELVFMLYPLLQQLASLQWGSKAGRSWQGCPIPPEPGVMLCPQLQQLASLRRVGGECAEGRWGAGGVNVPSSCALALARSAPWPIMASMVRQCSTYTTDGVGSQRWWVQHWWVGSTGGCSAASQAIISRGRMHPAYV